MKRFIAILLIIQFSLLTGCAIPFLGNSSAPTENQEMIKVPENSQVNSEESSTSDGVSQAAASGVTNGAANGIAGEADSTAAAGTVVPPAKTGVLDAATTSSASSGTTDSTADRAVPPLTQADSDEGTDISAVSTESPSDAESVFAETRRPVTVYYQDGDGYLIPMTRWIQMQQGIARAAVGLDIDSAIAREEVAYYGVYPVIPVDTDILGIDIRDGIATIDFDRHLLNYNNAASERNIIASIVYTLTEFKTINKVRILVNGYPQDILKYGTVVSEALGREDIAINTDTPLLIDGSGKVDVFLFKKANEGFTYLTPVSVVDSESAGGSPEILVKRLLDKNADGGLYTEMPGGVDLLKCSMNNGILTLDFSESFTEYGGNTREEGILKQLAYTVRQVEGINKVKIYVEGQEVELPEGTDISRGLAIPATINDVMDR